ncbi:alpha/beta fold hydrolase [Fimbriimonas ginsengisoli]|uniref:Pdz domain (Also known as dhr or glgf) protein n=1 Tax=Fimbriimonas ginsengisoli Gsoil 348 TaxID=661478 RepID=A0A068NPY4_FIMGI|nr:alpha/beta fold hydrolase [Fimbriimonas ginsengisoli]AIE83649.1 pdz domain (also known as dhr or glgf) protein [Fimbriimonas ginsengisoli Gsoil 348]
MRFFVFLAVTLVAVSAFASPLPRRGTLRVPLKPLAPEVLQRLKRKPQTAIQIVAPGAELPGTVKDGDIIVALNGRSFSSFGEFNDLVRGLPVGSDAKLKVLVDGKEAERTLPIVERVREVSDKYEVIYDQVVSHGHRIRTIVTRPKAAGRYPVLFWIQGINASTIDSPLSSNNYIANAMRPFAEDGFVTVRVEKPGVGDSEGGPAIEVGFDEENDIYRQALKALPGYDFVDPQRIFIFGHSMGGCHAPIIASEFPVRGIITYGTVSDSWLEWEIKSPRIQGPLAGDSLATVDGKVRKATAFYHYLFNEKRSIAWIKANHPELRAIADDESPDGKTLNPRSIRYMQECNDRNYCAYWANTGNARVLALFGENDWISLEPDQHQVAAAVNAAHPGYGTFMYVPGADHLFSKCTSMADSYARFGKGVPEFNPELVRITRAWIDKISAG